MIDKPIQLDEHTLPIKYLALCKIMAELTDSSMEEVDVRVQFFIIDTAFEANETPEEEIHLNG